MLPKLILINISLLVFTILTGASDYKKDKGIDKQIIAFDILCWTLLVLTVLSIYWEVW